MAVTDLVWAEVVVDATMAATTAVSGLSLSYSSVAVTHLEWAMVVDAIADVTTDAASIGKEGAA